jgi:NAD(P)-dependent dehydrogenase (short-subunit alcohol dehydrogenase family)
MALFMRQSSRVVVITGASAGVGRATVRRFASRGDRIALLARNEEALRNAAGEVKALGGQALVIPTDVSDADAIERAAERIEQELGPIDVWINNAMVSVFAPVKDMTAEEYRRVTEVTYLGYVYGTLSALKRMRSRDRGVIVQVGSALAYRSIPLQSAYCAAKHAIQGFTEALRSELIHDKSGIKVTEVHLPAVNTPQFGWSRAKLPRSPQPVPPIFQPEVAADAIEYASRHPRREYWVGFSATKAIVGGKLAPGFADWYLAKTGYDSQFTDEPLSPDREDILFAPATGDRGAHGEFDDRAKRVSLQFWLSKNRAWLAGTVAMLGIGWLAKSRLMPRVESGISSAPIA